MDKKPIERIHDDKEVNKYYDKLIASITEEWQNQNYDGALKRIEEELEQPYIPYEYEDMLSDMFYSYQRELKLKTIDENIKNMSANDMLVEINRGGKFNSFLFELFIQKYGDKLEKPQLAIMQLWLQDKNMKNLNKFFILDALAENNVDEKFIFYNANVDDDIVLSPTTYRTLDALKPYDEAGKIINEETFKDPVLQNFALDVLNATAYHYFPSFPFSSDEELAFAILNSINNSINMVDADRSTMTEDDLLVEKVIRSFDEDEAGDL
ncbi:DUF3196 family protein [Ureaplasma ceti]|uniref:Uncharacterized protein n=1 Tax=Ureaplasma ceti TaxID=3119530 RepID=A0ABP9U5K7_9BACT